MHSARYERHGDPLFSHYADYDSPLDVRFWRFVVKPDDGDGCWLWAGCKRGGTGYGGLSTKDGDYLAHRISYELNIGPIPEGLVIDHLCRVRDCVNPSHLEAVTHRENIRRGLGGVLHQPKSHCNYGHALTPDNIYTGSANGKKKRDCRECALRRNRDRKRAAVESRIVGSLAEHG